MYYFYSRRWNTVSFFYVSHVFFFKYRILTDDYSIANGHVLFENYSYSWNSYAEQVIQSNLHSPKGSFDGGVLPLRLPPWTRNSSLAGNTRRRRARSTVGGDKTARCRRGQAYITIHVARLNLYTRVCTYRLVYARFLSVNQQLSRQKWYTIIIVRIRNRWREALG